MDRSGELVPDSHSPIHDSEDQRALNLLIHFWKGFVENQRR